MCSQSKLPRALLKPHRPTNHVPRAGGETELVDMAARAPLPDDLAVPGHFDEAVVFEHDVGHVGVHVVGVRQDQSAAAFPGIASGE